MRTSRRFLISGRVQGVGFRYFVQSVAIRESLSGWVRNLDDGRVETAAMGDKDAMGRFECALRQRPERAGRGRRGTFPMSDHSAASTDNVWNNSVVTPIARKFSTTVFSWFGLKHS
jgi:acylphosphatase